MIRVALFASGQGSNALHLLRYSKSLPELQIPLVIVDKKESPLPEILRREFPEVEVPLILLPKDEDKVKAKARHEENMLTYLRKHSIDWCFLAGYLRLIGPTLLEAFRKGEHSRIVNIHPSLLPAYPGLHAYERAFEANDPESGVTIHLVDNGLDTGPILKQSVFPRARGDTLETFIARGKQLEWKLYAETLKLLHDEGNLTPVPRKS